MSDALDTYALALATLAATPTSLAALLDPAPAGLWSWSPAEGEWSLAETLSHMLHVETRVIPVRVLQMLAGDGAALAMPDEAPPLDPVETLTAWRAAREANLAFLRTLTPKQLARGGVHPRLGRISAREHIVEWAYHDLEHLRQLQATIEAALYPDIGGFHGLYPPPYPVGA